MQALGHSIDFTTAKAAKDLYQSLVPPLVYREYICYSIAELRDYLDKAEAELLQLKVEANCHCLALLPIVIEQPDDLQRISILLTPSFYKEGETALQFKHQFNTMIPMEMVQEGGTVTITGTDPDNPFLGDGSDLSAYDYGQGHPFLSF